MVPILIVVAGVLLLLLLVIVLKLSAFFSLIITSLAVGIALGMPISDVIGSIERGMGSTLGSLTMILGFGVMLGKLIADGGGVHRISTGLIRTFGMKNVQWAVVLIGFAVGIPMFYNVGFVILVPFVFAIAAQTGLPLIYVGLPMLASLSVTHGYLPPHPGPTAIGTLYNADMGLTLIYGIVVAIPAVILGGVLFSWTLKGIRPNPPAQFMQVDMPADEAVPGFWVSLLTGLLPVLLIALASGLSFVLPAGSDAATAVTFVGNPIIALLISVFVAIFTMGIARGKTMKAVMLSLEDAVRSIAMILFIIGAAGSFKEVLVDSGVGDHIATWASDLSFSPLILVWAIAAAIRVALGSATVAGLMAGGIALPLIESTQVSAELMVLATGAGSLMFSHVNDTGFWMFKEYFGLSIRDTILSWSLMESIVSIVGLIGVLLLDIYI
ncbi:gluconate:H+ symporter [Parapedobacter koreensis]|uniref:Gluconate permease GntT n=1 Tax=Parapedobacter koreensis TaxID=332977 RepID=A0A1H7NU60_9SPHI|nr:gluconate:H+ symporter [Parapedobacter koreensis]SEL27103.1 gluconate permease GntT [Parapedobacter koreensis]